MMVSTKVCEVGTSVYEGVEDDEVAGQPVDWHMSEKNTQWRKVTSICPEADCCDTVALDSGGK